MSLFGTSPEGPTSSRKATKDSLFDDEPTGSKQGSGLFDSNDDPSNSPWGLPTPKKQGRGNLIKSLLPANTVPEFYIDAFNALLESDERSSSGVHADSVTRLLKTSSLNPSDQEKILNIVLPRNHVGDSLDRSEFNVLLALIGLAQEGEDLSLDSVDERKRSLPKPTLPSLPRVQPVVHAGPPTSAPSSTEIDTEPSSFPPHRSIQSKPMSLPDQDPWASPAQSRPNNHLRNGSSNGQLEASMPHRTTSAFSTTTGIDDEPPKGGNGNNTRDGSEEWPAYNGSSGSGYGDTNVAARAFAGIDRDENDEPINNRPHRSIGVSRPTVHGAEETVVITALPEKEGRFLFQYRNYELSSSRRNSKVVRRYSDFVWLLDCLHKKFPFRQLPLLPPKRVAINGNHIAADTLFIEKRRRGLARFANALVRHPVLSQEQLVVMFLTVPTELAAWRKQASISSQEEFSGKPLPPTLEDSLPPTLDNLFDTVRSGTRRSAETYINLCTMLERLIKRKEGLGLEYTRFSSALQSLTDMSADTYHYDTNDVPMLNEGINATAKHISQHQSLLIDEVRTWDEGVLEDFKRQRDGLVSLRDMFDRKDKLARDNIPQLEKRIANNENKLAGVRAKPDRKPGEAEKLEDAIMKDKESIVNQHARGVFIKECVRDEIAIFQSSQYHVSRLHQDWSQERVKYSELQGDNWRALSDQVESMPLPE